MTSERTVEGAEGLHDPLEAQPSCARRHRFHESRKGAGLHKSHPEVHAAGLTRVAESRMSTRRSDGGDAHRARSEVIVAHLSRRTTLLVTAAMLLAVAFPATTVAEHSWGDYHWSRGSNPVNLVLGDAVSAGWDTHLMNAVNDWNGSSVLSLDKQDSSVKPRKCSATSGKINVCNTRYGYNGWLGVARIWVNGDHIYQSTVKLNDSYFDSSVYGGPAWRNSVMCQEIGHAFGLDHQGVDFSTSLGTCMDYSNDPVPNQHPDQHDYAQLEIIYTHLDGSSSVDERPKRGKGKPDRQGTDQSAWGRRVAVSNGGHTSVHVKGLGAGKRIVTFVIWA
jgi:hypothetical protein